MSGGDWIEWNGGDCPVAGGVRTEVEYRTGARYIWDDATIEDWLHYADDPELDIIAYRVVSA